MNINNGEEILALLNRLLEGLQQAGGATPNGSHYTFVYVAPGAQHVDTVQNQYVKPHPSPLQRRGSVAAEKDANPPFDADTPLSALFHESHHEELSQIIDSWRPYLKDNETDTDALAMSHFEFDFDKVIATHIYIDLGRLLYAHALKDDNMSLLAKYLFQHSNLSNSQSTLYVQLRKYKKR